MKKPGMAAVVCLSALFFTFAEELLVSVDTRLVPPEQNYPAVIEEWAFAYSDLTAIHIPDGVTTIGKGAFAHNALSAVTLPESLQTIGEWAFAHNGISSIVFPESVAMIGGFAFWGNTIVDIVIGDFVHLDREAIDKGFYECYTNANRMAGHYVFENGNWRRR
jgi:hypothetical protein